MTQVPEWWRKPRRVSVVVDNPSWLLPHAEQLVARLIADGDKVLLCRNHVDIAEGAVAFYLGCVHITPPEVLARNRRNLLVHESALPEGRGFSPLTWQVLEGRNVVPICLLEAAEQVDTGRVVYSETLMFEGHELIDEMRAAQGRKTIELCQRFMGEPSPPAGEPQTGQSSEYPRRRPEDSRLDLEQSLAAQFELLRVVDNERYPAFFEHRGHRYVLHIRKDPAGGEKPR